MIAETTSHQPLKRLPNGQFPPGYCPPTAGQGRPKGQLSGRAQALKLLDDVTGETSVKASIVKALREEALKRPMRFFTKILMPLFPKELLMKVAGEEGAMQWVSYLTLNPTQASESLRMIEDSDFGPSVADADGGRPGLPPPSSSTSPD